MNKQDRLAYIKENIITLLSLEENNKRLLKIAQGGSSKARTLANLKKTAERFQYKGIHRIVYVGKRGAKYVCLRKEPINILILKK